ncbi:hypothetical protein I5L01_01815 [Erythrobacter sp. YJ-T3-07]|uniref:hypothetical protein n=1 Tax=Erythrobacter sp. YJ-T3-07 TaxID=2793063 RepID=UPI0018D2FAFC|nr:hypothetical protein [Erythrobacter sp. YJ-T3-07]MBH1942959.1 hypothetical protein [Erythrobacter sp. YJ-T3-07]
MKTIYTDQTGALPWVWLFLGTLWVILSVERLRHGFELFHALGLLAALGAYGLAINRFLKIRRAKAEGRDHTIVRVTNAPDR